MYVRKRLVKKHRDEAVWKSYLHTKVNAIVFFFFIPAGEAAREAATTAAFSWWHASVYTDEDHGVEPPFGVCLMQRLPC